MRCQCDTCVADTIRTDMERPDYRPVLMTARHVADLANVDIHAVYMWARRSDRTGIRKHPGGLYDVNAVLLWQLTRDNLQAERRARIAQSGGRSQRVIHCARAVAMPLHNPQPQMTA